MRSTLVLFLCWTLALCAHSTVICRTRGEAIELVRIAGSEDVLVRTLYALSAPGDGSDADDLQFERDGLATELERLNMLVPVHDAERLPNLVAPLVWPGLYLLADTGTARARAAPAPHPGTVYYDSDGVDTSHLSAWVASGTTCALLFENATQRSASMMPTMHELVAERGFFDVRPQCSDVNHRLIPDPNTLELRCQCPVDKVCGSAGLRHTVLLYIVEVLYFALALIGIVVILYVAITQLQKRQIAAEIKRRT